MKRKEPSPDDHDMIIVKAPVNIALIKYWGKRNEDLILPLNDSISVAIDELTATTTLSFGPLIKEDSIVVNGHNMDEKHTKRLRRVLLECQQLISRRCSESGEPITKSWHIKAAGFAAIAFGLGQKFHLDEKDIVRLARLGSGSACRSVLSGFIHWKAGTADKDDYDCTCEAIAPKSHWPELRAVIVVVSQDRKKIGSSEAMHRTLETSDLLKLRAKHLVPTRVQMLRQAILSRDFPELAQITMAESNQLHALCLDTNPPVNFLNAISHAFIEFVHAFNAHCGACLIAYTFDAGPNCCLLLEEGTLPLLKSAFMRCFSFNRNLTETLADPNSDGSSHSTLGDDFRWTCPHPVSMDRIIVSKVGMGPSVCEETTNGTGKAACTMGPTSC